jgi:hypothetical protein
MRRRESNPRPSGLKGRGVRIEKRDRGLDVTEVRHAALVHC